MLGFFLFPSHINIIEIFVPFNHFASTLNHFNTSKKKKERKICGLKKDKNPPLPTQKRSLCASQVSVCVGVWYIGYLIYILHSLQGSSSLPLGAMSLLTTEHFS